MGLDKGSSEASEFFGSVDLDAIILGDGLTAGNVVLENIGKKTGFGCLECVGVRSDGKSILIHAHYTQSL